MVLENPSTYLEFQSSTWTEWDFLGTLACLADCGILLDVNNVYVSARNHGFEPQTYIDAIPQARVVQMHLAGHTDYGTHILDTHSTRVVDEVWSLYAYASSRFGQVSTLLEWDEDIPSFPEVHAEARKARLFRTEAAHAAA
ncbi:DUF692 family protein [Oscillatoria amoena NRMC-F 0135]|nr:DUF692 family protein [Oscillatoria amoena NRMC-F 0135]